ncbi:glycoside hydrolase [Ophiostoma piceae UAMH 11346]|uniref:mannan endo-1,4-beta-mannosidase n=1 Tax=Ophiostoma piceae (strain UAMH 11346) TaxID=1262450 RepID=S3C342_OPHP1|nr:glycoside hydrolase [Ophiostoma piceae UAMH 11346]
MQITQLAALAAFSASVLAYGTKDVRNLHVTRNKSQLLLDGKPWKAVGANIYWLGLDENVIPKDKSAPFYAPYNASYPTKGRVSEIMDTVRTLGGTAIRAHTLGVSTGCPLSIWPAPHETNAQAFEAIDWAVYQARLYGLRLLVPLTDNYAYYHGSKFDFLQWAGYNISGTDRTNPIVAKFYTNETVIALYHDYIRALITHRNPYTKLTYAEDPTIFAFETGNELTGPVWLDMDIPVSWLQSTARLLKQLAPAKLVVDGTYGINGSHLTVDEVDIVSNHFYPLNATKVRENADLAVSGGKVFLAGEYSWTSPGLEAFFSELENHPGVGGDMFWSLFGHNVPDCSTYVDHVDGFTLQYGNPLNSADTNARIKLIRQHLMAAGQKKSITADAALPPVACPGCRVH